MSLHHHNIDIKDIDAFIFDFDGVLTNNFVYIGQDGKEVVVCSRADGLAFDLLKKLSKPAFILSTEKNPVVSARADKLQVPVIQGTDNKVNAIYELIKANKYNLENLFYVGNDINDYYVMQLCGHSACPSDSHPVIKKTANYLLNTKGGEGVAREILEVIFQLNFIKILYD
jgi:N-acylneuraminate cytidylyltransferase/3-deoxy-D-manno-octulosonate 8-phosphate phosphatase (KDO 8-P phosphatase)